MTTFTLAPDLLVTIRVSTLASQAAVETALAQINGVELISSDPVSSETATEKKSSNKDRKPPPTCAEHRAQGVPYTWRGQMFRIAEPSEIDVNNARLSQPSIRLLYDAIHRRFSEVRVPINGVAIWQVIMDNYGLDENHRYRFASGRAALSFLHRELGLLVQDNKG